MDLPVRSLIPQTSLEGKQFDDGKFSRITLYEVRSLCLGSVHRRRSRDLGSRRRVLLPPRASILLKRMHCLRSCEKCSSPRRVMLRSQKKLRERVLRLKSCAPTRRRGGGRVMRSGGGGTREQSRFDRRGNELTSDYHKGELLAWT